MGKFWSWEFLFLSPRVWVWHVPVFKFRDRIRSIICPVDKFRKKGLSFKHKIDILVISSLATIMDCGQDVVQEEESLLESHQIQYFDSTTRVKTTTLVVLQGRTRIWMSRDFLLWSRSKYKLMVFDQKVIEPIEPLTRVYGEHNQINRWNIFNCQGKLFP